MDELAKMAMNKWVVLIGLHDSRFRLPSWAADRWLYSLLTSFACFAFQPPDFAYIRVVPLLIGWYLLGCYVEAISWATLDEANSLCTLGLKAEDKGDVTGKRESMFRLGHVVKRQSYVELRLEQENNGG